MKAPDSKTTPATPTGGAGGTTAPKAEDDPAKPKLPADDISVPRRDASKPRGPADPTQAVLEKLPTYSDARREALQTQREEDERLQAELQKQKPADDLRKKLFIDSKECMRCHPDPNKKPDFKLSLSMTDFGGGPGLKDKINQNIDSRFESGTRDLSWQDRAKVAGGYADKLVDSNPLREAWMSRYDGNVGRGASDDFRVREAERMRKAADAPGLSDAERTERRNAAADLLRRPVPADVKKTFDQLAATDPQRLGHRDSRAALELIDRYKPADAAAYDPKKGIKKGSEGMYLSDGEANRLFDARIWDDKPKPELDRKLFLGDSKECMRCHPKRDDKPFDLSGFDRTFGKGGGLGGRDPLSVLGDPGKKPGLGDTPAAPDTRSPTDRSIDNYLRQSGKTFASPQEREAEVARLKRENEQLQRIRAQPDNPINYLRSDRDKLSPEQKRIADDTEHAYQMRKLEGKIRPQFERLDAEYARNKWGEDSPWHGVDNAAFLKDLADKPGAKISRYDAFRGLNAIDDYRKQNADVFAQSPDSFRGSREKGNSIYYRNLEDMRAAKLDDFAAREKAIKEDPNNPIAYLRNPMAQLSDADHARVTKDYSQYAVDKLQGKLRGQAVAGIGEEVDRLDRHFDRMLRDQGVVGDTANWIKNHIGTDGGWIADSNLGSDAVGRTIAGAYQAKAALRDLANFQGTPEEFQKAYQQRVGELEKSLRGVQTHMQKFQKSQDSWVDGIADVTSAIAAVGGAALAPVTGGASLLVGAGIGAAVKVGVKGVDALTGSGEYRGNMLVDGLTGGLNGATGVGSGMLSQQAGKYMLKQATMKLAAGESVSMLTRAGIFLGTRSTVGAADGFVNGTANALIKGEEDPLGHGLRGAAFGAVLFPLTEGASAGLGKLWKGVRGGAGGAAEPGAEAAARRLDPSKPLALDADPAAATGQVQKYLADQLGIPVDQLKVKANGQGRSGDQVFMVSKANGESVGVFKVFNRPADAAVEADLLRTLNGKGMKQLRAVGEMGDVPVELGGQARRGLLMETAQGSSLGSMAEGLPPVGAAERAAGVAKLGENVDRVAKAMAEMHGSFTHGEPPVLLNDAQKKAWSEFVLSKLEMAKKSNPALAEELDRVRTGIEKAGADMLKSDLPATAAHGDANIGNFIVDGKGTVRVIDVGSMKHSLDPAGLGKSAGAADAGRFMESLAAWTGKSGAPSLQPAEVTAMQNRFLEAYAKASGVPVEKLTPAVKLAQAELEIAAVRFARTPEEATLALARLRGLLGQ